MNIDLLNFSFGVAIGVAGAIASYFVFKTKTEMQADAFKKDIDELKKHMDRHDEQDKQVEEKLSALIERNKNANDAVSQTIQNKLENISNSIVELKTVIKYKLKID